MPVHKMKIVTLVFLAVRLQADSAIERVIMLEKAQNLHGIFAYHASLHRSVRRGTENENNKIRNSNSRKLQETCSIAISLTYCSHMNGLNVTSIQAVTALDVSVLATFNALASAGQIANNADCQFKFSRFACSINGVLCNLNASSLALPCLQRCVDYHIACLGVSVLSASQVCSQTAGISNSADNRDCFCGSDSTQKPSAGDFCEGACDVGSACVDRLTLSAGAPCLPQTVAGLSFCPILNGLNVTSLPSAQIAASTTAERYAALAVSGLIRDSADCKVKFAAFHCIQGLVGCDKSSQHPLLPCLQRCLDYQTACAGLSPAAALRACVQTAGAANAGANSDCFCGTAGNLSSSGPPVCIGPCPPASECGRGLGAPCKPVVAAGLGFCSTLNGVALSSLSSPTVADVVAASSFAASLAPPAGLPNSSKCRQAYAGLYCPQGLYTCGGLGILTQTPLLPCLQRCIDYQAACLGLSLPSAAAACAASADRINSADDSDCFCGSDSDDPGGLHTFCSGPCHPDSGVA